MTLSPEFIRSLENLPGVDRQGLVDALGAVSPVSVRFNPFKMAQKPEGMQVEWCRYGYYLDSRPRFTLDPLFHAGVYYVQEASSMFVGHVFSEAMDGVENPVILDMCAAPGGKTTILSTLAGAGGLVVANETIRQRANILADNVRKWGIGNVAVTNNDPSHFAGYKDFFDMVLVDAPCSGEGMFRKNPDSVDQWSPENVNLCAARQGRIIAEVWDTLKPGGLFIYSTCTFNTAENEDNLRWMAGRYDYQGVDMEVPAEWGIVRSAVTIAGKDTIFGYRFYPDKAEGEGFFLAVLRKADGKVRKRVPKARKTVMAGLSGRSVAELSRWVGQPEHMSFATVGDAVYGYYKEVFPLVRILSETLTVIYSGVAMGQIYSGILKPDHPLALFHDLRKGVVPTGELTLDQALVYLRKGEVDPHLFVEGINLVTYNGYPLGWVKRIGHRCNNMYPKELRIATL